MSIQAPQGILNIPNATLRVGKLAVDEVVGADTILNTVARNTILLVDGETYDENKNWGLKLPNAWAGEFECNTASAGNFSEFNFYNEGASSNAQGYNLTFNDTAVELRYDGTLLTSGTLASTVTGTGVKKVRLMFERTILSVTVDGTLIFTHDDTGGPRPRVYSTTAGGFLNFFTDGGALKNLKIVNEKWMSDGTSNIAYVGGGEVAVGKALAFNRVSNVSQIKVDSNVVTEYTGPHDRPLRKYPEVAMTANDNLSTSGYKASVSSLLTGSGAFKAFDVTGATSYWHSQYPYYTFVTGTYNPGQASQGTGTPSGTLPTTELISGHQGEWIKLQMPKKIKLEEVRVYASNRAADLNVYQMPKDIAIAGSNDGTNWYLVDSGTLRTGIRESYGMASLPVTTSSYYSYLALIVKTIDNQGADYSAIEIANIEYYGYEEGSGSLDTTLKSVYNVPATTGTQLEVYYDGQDYTGVTSTVTDKAGTATNATIANTDSAITFDSTYKAWTFGGTDTRTSNIQSSALASTFSGDQVHSVALWFKCDVVSGDTLFSITQPSDPWEDNKKVISVRFSDESGGLRYLFWSNDIKYDGTEAKITKDIWYHLCVTYSGGGGTTENKKLYLNGNELHHTSTSGTYPGADLELPSGSVIRLGSRVQETTRFFGSIANFRLYSKALNADQVKELYDYQKDYFLGSKSQVTLYKGHLGVGVTEPLGQLELAGDERIQEYPPRIMTDYEMLMEGHGVFCVSASSNHPTYKPWYAFDGETTHSVNDNSWISGTDALYDNASTGLPTAIAARTTVNGAVLAGEWIQMSFPYKIHFKQVALAPQTDSEQYRAPKDATIAGSNDGVTWDTLHTFTNQTSWTDNQYNYYTMSGNVDKAYKYVRIIIQRVQGNSTYTSLAEVKYFGTPGPTTLDKGSLTLTRSLDVPRVSRYDVDTETPRPEKLLIDLDTTVNSSPTDISGKGNHGAFYGDASYSPADKAFVFDGNGDYIKTGGIGNDSGVWEHSVSLWFKLENISQAQTLWYINANSSGESYNTPHVVIGTDGRIRFDMWSSALYSPDNTITGGIWYHVVTSLSATNNTKRIYINGTLIATHTTSDSHNVDANASLWIGAYGDISSPMTGKISNFKVYDTVLEPSEVKKLYNLGRTGRSMVISDTAVGIGKVPEAQLDVRGTARFADVMINGSASNGDCSLSLTENPSASAGVRLKYDGVDNALHLMNYDDDATIATFMRSGNVGIGVTDPNADLFLKCSSDTFVGGGGMTIQTGSGNKYWRMIASDYQTLGRLAFGYSTNNTSWSDSGYLVPNSNSQMNFTGQHRTFIKDVPFTEIEELHGLIVSSDQNKYIKMSGGIEAGSNAITMNESLPVVSLSTKVNDKKCFGVISASEDPESRQEQHGNFGSIFEKELGDTRVYINSVGEGAIWVTNINGSLESGDYITTSNVAGYGQKQDSDSLKNYTVAKITMDCDFDPVTQPVQIIRKETSNVNYWVMTTYENVSEEEYSNLDEESRRTITETVYTNEHGEIFTEQNEEFTYVELEQTIYQKITNEESKTEQEGYELEVRQELVNVLDEHGQLQWEDHPTETEKAYKIRYLDANGAETDEANHVYKAAFVGCTYHCG